MSLRQLSDGLPDRYLRLRRNRAGRGFYQAGQQKIQRRDALRGVDTRAADRHSARQQTEDQSSHDVTKVSHWGNIGRGRVVAIPISESAVPWAHPAVVGELRSQQTASAAVQDLKNPASSGPTCRQAARAPVAGARANSLSLHSLIWMLAALGLITGDDLFAAETPVGPARFVERAQRLYLQARERHAQQPGDPATGVRLAKACFDRAEFATNDTERAALAVEGINVCRQVIERDSASAAAHLFLGLNLGQLARTKTLGALRLVGEMETEFKRAIALEPAVEYAGPDRYLGQLYHQAPGWPTSIGSRSRARQHLTRACELSPDYPDNRLALLEALMEWHDRRNFLKEARLYLELLPASRGKYSGEPWAAAWAEWDQRWQKLAAYLAKLEEAKHQP